MSLARKLGLDARFDATAPETRKKALIRVGIALGVAAWSAPLVGAAPTLGWLVLSLAAELWLWLATEPRGYLRHPARMRASRLGASFAAGCCWVVIASIHWATGDAVLRHMALAMLCGVVLYVQQSCGKTPIHAAASASPAIAALVVFPFTYGSDAVHLVAALGGTALLLGFALSSTLESVKSWRRLEAANAELVEEREAARAANRAKTEFLANMSHEIRTPLNGVVGVVDVLGRTRLSADQREMVEIVRASGETLKRLLSDLLDLARIEAGRVELEVRPFHLGDMVRSVAALSALRAQEKAVALLIALDPSADRVVLGDEVRLKQVVGNLLSNAVKFTTEGEVELTVEAVAHLEQPAFRFTVRDTGVGFHPSEKDRIFGRFQQADGSITRRFGGTGLGLSISRQLAELMGGVLDAEGEPGVGATFTCVAPLQASDAVLAPAFVEPALAGDGAVRRVLLADDHPVNRKVVELMLDRADVALVSVEDGLQAYEAVRAEPWDLVLMDMQMPVMDGLTAVRAIRAFEVESGRTRTPIVMLTANALREHMEAAQAAGADGHLAKPITAQALLAVLEQPPQAAGREAA